MGNVNMLKGRNAYLSLNFYGVTGVRCRPNYSSLAC